MNKVVIWVIALVISAGVLRGQEHGEEIIGVWQGTLHAERDLRTVIKISKADAGGLKAVFYSIDQAAQGLPATSTNLQGSLLKFSIGSIGGVYEGRLIASGNSIEGTWTLGANPRSLNLKRATNETAWVIPPPSVLVPPMAENADPVFEVATVKSSNPDTKGLGFRVSGRQFSTLNTTLTDLIQFAYGIHAKQIQNGPAWLDTSKFDIAAQPNGEGQPDDKQWKTMLQKLLADRFSLRFRRGKKELLVYALVLAKNGPKLTKSEGDLDGLPGFLFRGPGILGARNATMLDFTSLMQGVVLDRPVINQSGLTGRFDFELDWMPDDSQFGGRFRNLPPSDNPKPGLFAAVQEQLGLKLDSTKVAAEILIIDNVQKPSDN